MRSLIFILLISLTFSVAADKTFGSGADKSKSVDISKVLASPDTYLDKVITVSGKIDAVCKKKGCWMEFVAGDKSQKLRIKVKDGDMVFPVSAKGQTAYATGTITKREMSLEQTKAFYKHLAEEQGTDFDESTITKPKVMVQLAPVGVTIEG